LVLSGPTPRNGPKIWKMMSSIYSNGDVITLT